MLPEDDRHAAPAAGKPPPLTSSRVALWTLVALAVLSPWPFGGVPRWWVTGITGVGLVVAAGVLSHQLRRGGFLSTALPLVGPVALFVLALAQLLPLPPWLHSLMAPGSYRVWHPAEPAAAEVLGNGWRPISIFPAATCSWIAMAGAIGTLVVLGAPAARERRVVIAAAWTLVAAGTVVAVYGIVARVAFGPLLYGRIVVPTVMPFGPFVNKNHFAAYVSLSAVLALGLGWGLARQAAGSGEAKEAAAPPGSAVVAYGMAMAMLISVLLSLSRAGALGLAAGVSTFLIAAALARRRRRSLRWPVAAGLAVATVIVLSQLPSHVYGRLGTLMRWRQETSASFRLNLWQDSLRTWRQSPWLGYGFAAYADALPPQKTAAEIYRVEHAENDGLELAVEGGAAGVMMVALCVALPVAAIARRLKSCDRVTRGIVCGALGAAAAFLVHGLFDFPFHIPAAVLSLAVVVALAGAAGGASVHSGGRSLAIAVGVLLGAATALAFAGAVPDPRATRTLALRAAGTGDAEGRRLRLALAEASVLSDLERRPADPEAWLALAWIRHAEGLRQEGERLADYAVSLDPMRPELRASALSLSSARP